MIIKSRGEQVRIANLTVGQMLGDQTRGSQLGSVSVTHKTAGGLPAAGRAIGIAAESVAKRKLGVWRGPEEAKTRVTTTWQARLFAGQPNERESWSELFEQLEASLTGRNNGFLLKSRNDKTNQVEGLYFVPRDRVEARWNRERHCAEYRIADAAGNWSGEWFDASVVMHFRVGHVEPGSLIVPTPVERYRDALKAALSKVRFEGNHFDQGILNALAVTFPGEVTPEQARRYREALQSEHGGVDNAGGIRVFGGGASVATIGVSLADAQFIESMNLDVEQIARIYRVWASLIGGSAQPGSRQVITPEHEEDRWNRHGLESRLMRIEQRFAIDPDFFGVGARDFPAFLPAPVRGDVAAESNRLTREVQAGVITSNEARAEKGLPPLPGGDTLQITPVGGAPNDPAPAMDPYPPVQEEA
jgi:HK97 family phage portal protein